MALSLRAQGAPSRWGRAMNWTAISTLCEVAGVVAVVATLWYLALQIRQNTNAVLTTSRQGMLEADMALLSDFMAYGIDPHLTGDDVELDPQAERRLTWMVIKAIRIREFAWYQWKAGSLDAQTWDSYMAPVPGIFSTARARAVLDFYTGSPEFMALVRQRVAAAAP